METITIIACLIGFIISIIVLVKFFQIAADIRAIRQSNPLAYKFNLDAIYTMIYDAEQTAKIDKEYARKLLLLSKAAMSKYPESHSSQIAEVDKLLAEL